MHEPLLSLSSRRKEEAESPSRPSSHAHDPALAPSLSQFGSPPINLIANMSIRKKRLTFRSRSAPAVLFTDTGVSDFDDPPEPYIPVQKSSTLIPRLSFIGVILYLATGFTVYMISGSFKGTTTFRPVDAVYFTVVTLCSIGYGDIVPDAIFTKIFVCGFMLVGFGLIGFLLSGLVEHICDTQEAILLSMMYENRYLNPLVDEKKGRIRIRSKVFLALAVVIGCIAIGTVTVHFVEKMNWVDSVYLSISSVTTVGYGDYSFKTVSGRCFAIIWLLVSTLAFTRAFLYLTDYSMRKRNRKSAELALRKKLAVSDLAAADLDNDGSISKSEFVIYKLKKMKKISERDILPISRKFDSLDNCMHGKISLAGIMGTV